VMVGAWTERSVIRVWRVTLQLETLPVVRACRQVIGSLGDGFPREHRADDPEFEIVLWAEPVCRCEFDGGILGGIEVRACGDIEYFTRNRVIDE
jgi:hypothetical protein